MLDPWIIEEILKKEQEQRREERDRAEMPVPPRYRDEQPSVTPPQTPATDKEGERGVMIIDI
jgi:hypothetical protein